MLNSTVVHSFFDRNRVLFEGTTDTDPIQTVADPRVFDTERFVVVHGHVLDTNGDPLL